MGVSLTGNGGVTVATTESIPSLAAAANTDITVTWSALASAPKVTVSIVSDHAGDGLVVRRVRTVSTTGCVVNVANTGLISRSGDLNVVAML